MTSATSTADSDKKAAAKPKSRKVEAAAVGLPAIVGWGWCWKTIWPWLSRGFERGFAWPADGETRAALAGVVALPVATFVYYVIRRVWQEIEKDGEIYVNAAKSIRSFPRAAKDLFGRWRDAAWGVFAVFSFTRRYLREIARLRSIVDTRGLVQMTANRLEFDEVYVDLQAAPCHFRHGRPMIPPEVLVPRGRASIWAHLRGLNGGCALAIIGPPGSGKTTLLRHVMRTYARNRQWRWSYRARKRVPFFLELRKLPKLLSKKNGPNLPALIQSVIQNEDDLKPLLADMPKDWVSTLLKQGRCALLWDGLDEIPDAATRKKVSDWLDAQINHTDWRENLFLTTARPAGYASAPLQNAHVLDVQPFDYDDTCRFVRQWYLANEIVRSRAAASARTVRDLANLNASKLIGRLRDYPRLSALTSNPLLLTMICLMHELGELPGSRAQLYQEICEVHLERWRRNREVAGTWNAAQKLTVLRPLAVCLMERGAARSDQDSKRLSTDDMLREAEKPLDSLLGEAADRDARRAFFVDLQASSGLWQEWERDQWGFAHLSFQEYLCADRWAADPSSAPSNWAEHLEMSWWRETLLLYATKAVDIRPLIGAALGSSTPRSLTFLFALEGETITLPSDLKQQIDAKLQSSLGSQDPAVFVPAAEAWLLRRQDQYSRLDEDREFSGWVTQAEFKLFLQSLPEDEQYKARPPHAHSAWIVQRPRDPIVGVWPKAALKYCEWLDRRFPHAVHRLARETDDLLPPPDPSERMVFWRSEEKLSAPPQALEQYIVELREQVGYKDVKITVLARDLARALALALARALARALALDLARALARAHALARARNLALALDLDLDLALALARDLARWAETKQRLETMACEADVIQSRRAKVFLPLCDLWAPNADKFVVPSAYRRFLLAAIGAIREHDHKAISSNIAELEAALALIEARGQGEALAWEGIRVVRERRG